MLNNEKITKIIARRYIWLPFLMGVLLGIVCFVVFTGYDRMKIEKIADETLDFMQDRVKKYDDYKNNDKVKSLYRLADKTLELDQRLEEKDADQEELVERYMKDQRLDGVLLIDENLNCVYQAEDVGKMDTFWQEQMSEPAVKNMLEQPRKTYITRLDKEGKNYDFAVVSRTDGKGLVAAYIEKNMEDNGDISIYSLFTGFTFDMNGIVAVTDDKQVLSSNSEKLLSVKPGEYRDIFTPDIYTGDEHRMIHLESTGGSWYGEIKQMKDYTKLEKFIREHYASLRSVASRFVDPDTAQDITQNVIYKFWEKKEHIDQIKDLDSFLFTMIKNEALTYLRSSKNETNKYCKIPLQEDEETPEVLHIMIEEETNQILINAINQLPSQTAHIMRLVLSGYDNKEIAILVNISLNTVKTLKYGGIRKLREYFLSHQF